MQTSVAETFRDGTILITGGTGFLGKVLIEKLIRSCHVKNVVVLVRTKKGLDVTQRIEDIYKNDLFDRLRREKPEFMNCTKIVEGDLVELPTSLSSTDLDWMIENVNFIFHCAATVKFNEPIEVATKINVLGTENILKLARDMKYLKGIVHVSTAFSHCVRYDINEQYYPVPITAAKLKDLVKNVDKSTSKVIENWPNTYTFTKAVTENMISKNENHLPISIFRPSIIEYTKSEPKPNWIGHGHRGMTALVTPLIIGMIRAFPGDENKNSDVVPVDYTVNALISVMWETVNSHRNRDHEKRRDKEPKIYNFVSNPNPPVTWGQRLKNIYDAYYEAPPLLSYWYIFCITSNKPWVIEVLRIFLHRLPAITVDFVSVIFSGQSQHMWKKYEMLDKAVDSMLTFLMKDWKFRNDNVLSLWSSLSQEDREQFWFSFEDFDWKEYDKCIVRAIKKYILHEDERDLKKSLAKNRMLFWLHYLCVGAVIYFLSKLLLFIFV